jgi:hypothetical protein
MALFIWSLPQSQSLDTWLHCVFFFTEGKQINKKKLPIFHPYLFTQFHSLTAKCHAIHPHRNICLHLIEEQYAFIHKKHYQFPQEELSENIRWVSFCVLKKLYNGFQNGYVIWLVLFPKRNNRIPCLLRGETKGFPRMTGWPGRGKI